MARTYPWRASWLSTMTQRSATRFARCCSQGGTKSYLPAASPTVFGSSGTNVSTICDLFVPTKEQGLEAIVALRRISATTPIISMTGSVPMKDGKVLDRELLRIAEEFGAVQLIGKPFRMHDLLALVSRCLGSIAASAAALHTLWT